MPAIRCQRVSRRCYRDQFHTTHLDPLDAREVRIHSANADIGNAGMDQLDRATPAATLSPRLGREHHGQ